MRAICRAGIVKQRSIPQSLATAVLRLLENKTARREMCAAFGKIRPQLSVDGALLAALEMLS